MIVAEGDRLPWRIEGNNIIEGLCWAKVMVLFKLISYSYASEVRIGMRSHAKRRQ